MVEVLTREDASDTDGMINAAIIATEIQSRLNVPRLIIQPDVASYTPWFPHMQAANVDALSVLLSAN